MEKEGSRVATIKLVDAKKLNQNDDYVSDDYDASVDSRFKSVYDRFGQIKPIVVALVDGKVRIVDGNRKLKMLKLLGAEKILVSYLGEISEIEYVANRIIFNYHQPRINFIGMAEMIQRVTCNEHDSISLSSRTGIPVDDIKRFKDLLSFDWNAFLKVEVNPAQLSFFNDSRED